jgi:hypothetical protein
LDQDSLKKSSEDVTRSIAAEDYSMAFQQWFEQPKKSAGISGDFIIKY